MSEQARRVDVVVVGGGLAGLAAAAYLARAERKVLLVDRADAVGGRARTRTLDGYHFNLGPHALYRTGRGAAVLRELGVAYEGAPPPVEGAYALRRGRVHTLPVGFVSLLTTGLFGPWEKIEAARLLAGLRTLDTAPLRDVTLADWLRSRIGAPAVRELMETLVRVATYTHDPERLSAGDALGQLQRAFAGVLYLHGGWQTLVDRLTAVAESAGVRILTRAPAASVLRDGAVRGVTLSDGTTIEASTVVIAGSPSGAAALLSADGPSVVDDWAAQAIPVRAACLDLALERLPRPAARVAFGIDEPLYLSVHSAVARLAPGGGALVHVARYGGLRGESAAAVKSRLTALMDAVQPGWRHYLVRQRFLPDLVVANAMATAASGGVGGRPGPAVPGIPGLFVAGDWVGPEGLLSDASLASARAAALAIVADLGRARTAA